MRSRIFVVALGFVALSGSVAAFASETITYVYDARGRVTKVVRINTANSNNNNQACYKLDKVDNRVTMTATVSASVSTPTAVACPS